MTLWVILAGIAQLAVAFGSLILPRLLGWRADTAKLQPLTRQLFWTYAGYIWASHVGFGLLSALKPEWLLDRSPLARAVAAYIAAHWGARLLLQFLFFHRSGGRPEAVYRIAEAGLVALFVFVTVVYACVVARCPG